MIYIDHVHMVADSLEELHDFAEKIGLKRHYFQGVKKGHPHYDVLGRCYNRAISNGAVKTNSKEILKRAKDLANKK